MKTSDQEIQNSLPGGFAYTISKRVFDVAGAIVGLILLSPLFFIISVVIKLNSPGPVFYRGRRSGQYGKVFQIFKFRSMVIGADLGPGTTSRTDPRITSVGRFIRSHKLDEIPQLFNVLSGEMSFVGPRPELSRYTNQYSGDENIILMVKPGITDYSSIKFSNLNDIIEDENPDKSFETNVLSEKNRLRVKYVKNRSFCLDLKLIFLTIKKLASIK